MRQHTSVSKLFSLWYFVWHQSNINPWAATLRQSSMKEVTTLGINSHGIEGKEAGWAEGATELRCSPSEGLS